jgi:hypothetical protein
MGVLVPTSDGERWLSGERGLREATNHSANFGYEMQEPLGTS